MKQSCRSRNVESIKEHENVIPAEAGIQSESTRTENDNKKVYLQMKRGESRFAKMSIRTRKAFSQGTKSLTVSDGNKKIFKYRIVTKLFP